MNNHHKQTLHKRGQTMKQFPLIEEHAYIVLFDGVCKLCNRWVRFIIQHDAKFRLTLCSVQSTEGQAILQHFGYPTTSFDTMLFIENQQCYEQSDAVLRVFRQLEKPWQSFAALQVIPKPLRNAIYRLIARNRYRLFGELTACMVPLPEHERRFIQQQSSKP